MSELRDQPARDRCVCETGRGFLVEAGAGSGKTSLLAARACFWLLEEAGRQPSRLLCLTFTRNAAAQMRGRVARMLGAIAAGDARDAIAGRVLDLLRERRGVAADVAAGRAEGALLLLSTATIGTIHSFGQSILALHGHLIGLPTAGEPDEAAEAGAVRAAVEDVLFDPPPDVATRLASGSSGREAGSDPAALIGDLASQIAALDLDALALTPAEGPTAWVRDVAFDIGRRARSAALRAGLLGFGDMLSLSARLFRAHPGVAAGVAGRFAQVLVDEMQDTDPLQYSMVRALWEAAPAADRPVFFLVGDPKQSIYAFRHADIEAFGSFGDWAVASGMAEKLPIVTNFRSVPGVLDFVNAGVGPLMQGPGQAPWEPLVPSPGREADAAGRPPAVELHLQEEALPAEEGRQVQARRVAALAAAAHEAGTKWRDMAVLVKSWEGVAMVERTLRRAGVAFVVTGNRFLYRRQEVLDVLAVLEVLTEPWNTLAAAILLRSPIGGLDDSELAEVVAVDGLDFRDQDVAARLRPGLAAKVGVLHDKLRAVADVCGRSPAPLALAEAARILRLEPIYAAMGDLPMRNVCRVVATLADEARRGASGLWEVKETLRRRVDAGEEEVESAVLDDDLDAVRVGTIHGAKGLEFGTVFLPFFEALAAGQKRRPAVVEGPGGIGVRVGRGEECADATWTAEVERLDRMQDAEVVRLAYVATTRARDRLVILGAPAMKRGARDRLLPRLVEALGALDPAVATATFTTHPVGDPGEVRVATPTATPQVPDLADIEAARATAEAEAHDLAGRAWLTSPSTLDAERLAAADRDEETRPAPGASRGLAVEVGILAHALLERLDFADTEASLLALERDLPDLAGTPECDRALVADAAGRVRAFLRTPAGRELAASRILHREVPFAIRDGDRVVAGRMDVVYRVGDRVVVGDYKTGLQAGALDRMEAAHEEQRRVYLEAAGRVFGRDRVEFRFLAV